MCVCIFRHRWLRVNEQCKQCGQYRNNNNNIMPTEIRIFSNFAMFMYHDRKMIFMYIQNIHIIMSAVLVCIKLCMHYEFPTSIREKIILFL